MIRTGFGRSMLNTEFSSALIYKLQRKDIESGDQLDVDNTKDTSTSRQLLVIWSPHSMYKNAIRKLSIRTLLIKHSNIITWDEDKLKELHSINADFCRYNHFIRDTWLLDDATMLVTTSEWEEESCVFKITISEETRKDYSMEPPSPSIRV
jgi:hypothetical protein